MADGGCCLNSTNLVHEEVDAVIVVIPSLPPSRQIPDRYGFLLLALRFCPCTLGTA